MWVSIRYSQPLVLPKSALVCSDTRLLHVSSQVRLLHLPPPPTLSEGIKFEQQDITPVEKLRRIEALVECPSCGVRAKTRIQQEGAVLGIVARNVGGIVIGFVSQIPQPVHRRPIALFCYNCGKRLSSSNAVFSSGVTAEGFRGAYY